MPGEGFERHDGAGMPILPRFSVEICSFLGVADAQEDASHLRFELCNNIKAIAVILCPVRK